MFQIECQQLLALDGSGSEDMQGIINGTAGEVLRCSKQDGILVNFGIKRNDCKVWQDAGVKETLNISG